VHVVLVALAPSARQLESALALARDALGVFRHQRRSGARIAGRHRVIGSRSAFATASATLPIEAAGIAGRTRTSSRLRAGEFVLGYRDELGAFPAMPMPEALGRNGSYVVFRKAAPAVAAFRAYLNENSATPAEQELIAAKMMGRWRSGAPLALCPMHDDPALAATRSGTTTSATRMTMPSVTRRRPVATRGVQTRATHPSRAWSGCIA